LSLVRFGDGKIEIINGQAIDLSKNVMMNINIAQAMQKMIFIGKY
jgi:hypothetical protein